jgi:HK97 family phage major capsid protein
MKDVDSIGAEIQTEERTHERRQRVDELQRELGESQGRLGGPENPQNPQDGDEKQRNLRPRDTEEYREAFRCYIAGGRDELTQQQMRSLQADSSVKGGYTVMPTQFVAELLKDVDDAVVIRQLARVFPLETAESLGVPTLESRLDDFEWTAEVSTTNEDDNMTFGKRELKPHPVAKLVKVSGKLLRMSILNPELIVRQEMSYILGGTQEKGFMTGNGSGQPLGIFTASNDGISTSRDVSTGNTATDIKGDGLIEAKYKLKAQYAKNARWIFHRDALKGIRKLKDGNGNYIWVAGLTNGQPDTILEVPYIMSEFAPNTFTTGQYVGIIGDFRFYWIADALNMELQRLVELFSLNNKVGFIVRAETDAMPVKAEPFARVKLG